MRWFYLNLRPADYNLFSTDPATRLYVHKYNHANGELAISAATRWQLVANLEKALDFGASSADESLYPEK